MENGPLGGEAASLLAKAQVQGTVRVIVALDLAMQPEDAIGRPEAERQLRALRAMQDAVVQRAGLGAVTRFETIPFMATAATAAQLERLLRDPDVALVQEDVPHPPLAPPN